MIEFLNAVLPRLLTLSQVAELLQVSRTQLYRLVKTGDLPAVRFDPVIVFGRLCLTNFVMRTHLEVQHDC